MADLVYVLNGPNLNLLGAREPDIYGAATLDQIRAACERVAEELGLEIDFRQTNHEGVLIDEVQEAGRNAEALVINPAGYGHTSVALHDALKALPIPVVECHLSNPAARERFRRTSYVSPVAAGVVQGFGPLSYELALRAAARLIDASAPA